MTTTQNTQQIATVTAIRNVREGSIIRRVDGGPSYRVVATTRLSAAIGYVDLHVEAMDPANPGTEGLWLYGSDDEVEVLSRTDSNVDGEEW